MKEVQLLRSEHQNRVALFAKKMGFDVPDEITYLLPEKTRILLARLLLEEVAELVFDGLGVNFSVRIAEEGDTEIEAVAMVDYGIDPVEVVDGVCDVKFVATKILCLIGVPDEPFQHEVDMNNLMKFADGHTFTEEGKLKKPKDHPQPSIGKLLESLFPQL